MKKIILILVILVVFSLSSCSLSHIEDTNGEDNYSLNTLTEEDFFNYRSYVAVGMTENAKASSFSFKCSKFSGNYKVRTITPNEKNLRVLIDFEVISGNASVALIRDNQIYQIIRPNTSASYEITSGSDVDLRILGESCQVDLFVDIYEG